MRILHLIASLSPSTGGPAEACLGICRELVKHGHDVSIFTTNYGPAGTGRATDVDCPLHAPVYDRGVKIRFFAGGGRGRYAISLPLFRALRSIIPSIDIVHIHSLYLFHSTVGAVLCRIARVPYVIRPHGSLDPYLRRRHRARKWLHELVVERHSFRHAAAIQFTTAEELALASQSRAGRRLLTHAVTAVVPNGVVIPDESVLDTVAADNEDLRRRFPELRGKRIVLFLGRLTFKKGLDILAAAFSSLCRRRDDVHLLIAGPDNERYEARVKDWLRSANVLDRVTFAGMLRGTDKNTAFRIADMFVLPSYSENFGIAVVEAMASGLPVIVSDRVNIWREITEAAAGLVIKCDSAELATAISTLLDNSALRRSMGARGRALVQRSFTWEMAAETLIKLYERLLSERNTSGCVADGRMPRQAHSNPRQVEYK